MEALLNSRQDDYFLEKPAYEVAPAPESLPESFEPLEAVLDRFWDMGDGLDGFSAPVVRPAVEAGLLKRLGKPPFERKPGEIVNPLATAYKSVSDHALLLALGEESS